MLHTAEVHEEEQLVCYACCSSLCKGSRHSLPHVENANTSLIWWYAQCVVVGTPTGQVIAIEYCGTISAAIGTIVADRPASLGGDAVVCGGLVALQT